MRSTACVRSLRVRPPCTSSIASHMSPDVSPSSTTEASSSRGARAGTQGEELDTELASAPVAMQPPQLPHPQLGVAFNLAFVTVRDLDLDHQVGRGALDEGDRLRFPYRKGGAKVPGPLADVERAVGFHPGTGGFAPPPKTGAAQHLHGAGEHLPRGFHDIVEKLGELLMGERRRHQGNDPARRIETDLTEGVGSSLRRPARRRCRRPRAGRGQWSRGSRCAWWRAASWRVLVSLRPEIPVYSRHHEASPAVGGRERASESLLWPGDLSSLSRKKLKEWIPAEAGIHEKQRVMGCSMQAGIHAEQRIRGGSTEGVHSMSDGAYRAGAR